MSVLFSSKRFQNKRFDGAGIVPTIPTSAVTSQTEPDNTWLYTDLMVGEMAVNITDNKAWVRFDDQIVQIGYSGMTGQFIDLVDVPNTYVGAEGRYVIVNSAATALEFIDYVAPTSVTYSYELLDMPTMTTSGYTLITTTASTYELQENTFLNMNDMYTTAYTNGWLLVDNGVGYADIDPKTILVDLTNPQTIAGVKTFSNTPIFSDSINITGTLVLSGSSENIGIDNFSTDTGFTAASNTELATSLATKTYVDVAIAASAGVTGYTGVWVTTDTTQSISGQKTFAANTYFSENLEITKDLSVKTDVYITGNTYTDMTSYYYWGTPNTDDAYRQYINPSGDLEIQRNAWDGTGYSWQAYNYPDLVVDTIGLNAGGKIYLRDGTNTYLEYNASAEAIITTIDANKVWVVEVNKAYMYSNGPALLKKATSNTAVTMAPDYQYITTGVAGTNNEVTLVSQYNEILRCNTGGTYTTKQITCNELTISSSGTSCLTMYDVYNGDPYSVYISGGTLKIIGV